MWVDIIHSEYFSSPSHLRAQPQPGYWYVSVMAFLKNFKNRALVNMQGDIAFFWLKGGHVGERKGLGGGGGYPHPPHTPRCAAPCPLYEGPPLYYLAPQAPFPYTHTHTPLYKASPLYKKSSICYLTPQTPPLVTHPFQSDSWSFSSLTYLEYWPTHTVIKVTPT